MLQPPVFYVRQESATKPARGGFPLPFLVPDSAYPSHVLGSMDMIVTKLSWCGGLGGGGGGSEGPEMTK